MSLRLWTPLHGWLGKLGLCKPFCPSKIQCSKLKSPVSLCSSMSQLGREEGEWRFFSFTTWRFLKCHNQLFFHTLFSLLTLFILLFSSLSLPLSLYLLFPPLSFWNVLCQVLYSILIILTHKACFYYIFEKQDRTGWQAEGEQSHETVRKEKQTRLLTSSGVTRGSQESTRCKTKKGETFWW